MQNRRDSIDECLSDDQLVDLVENPNASQQHVQHFDSCEQCQRRVETLTGSQILDTYCEAARSKQFRQSILAQPLGIDELGLLENFTIESQIGAGGMGVVYRARDDKLGRTVAIKVLNNITSPTALARFERETSAASRLNHPNVVPVYSSGQTEDGRPFLVMPLIEGATLKQSLTRGTLEAHDIARIIHQVADGLEAAHQLGLVHRDVKPANILLDELGGTDLQARLVDFGLVRSQDDKTLTQIDVLCGSPEYMSPEQASSPGHEVDRRSDIYSLGITLYECLAGTPPFRGEPIHIIDQHRSAEPVRPSRLNPGVPRDLETICLKAISKRPSRRYQTATELAADLQRFLDGRPIHARAVGAVQRLWLWCKRNTALASMLALLAGSMLLGTTTTTVMWINSERNAAKAVSVAEDLKANRQDLRQSVRRFQGQIFSDEALHWQMTPSFRGEMFREVIAYLDKFAAQKANLHNDGQPDELTEDYLKIAESALAVSSFEEAILAADRALDRMRALNGEFQGGPKADSPNLANLSFHSRAAAASFRARQGSGSGSDDQLTALARESRDAAQRALEQSPDDLAMIVAASKARFLELSLSPQKTSGVADELMSIYTRLSELPHDLPENAIARLLAPTTVEIGWTIAASLPSAAAIELLERNEQLISNYRNALRGLHRPLGPSDYLQSINLAKIAANQYRQGNPELAIESAKQALASFYPALMENPQNRLWQREMANVEETVSDWLAEQGDLIEAEKKLTLSIQRHVGNRRGDPENDLLRVRIIKLFVKKAELSARSDTSQAANEFYVAAQDCRYFINNPENPRRAWAFEMRLWLLSQVVAFLPDNDQSEFATNFWKWERTFVERLSSNHPDLDAAEASAVLDGDRQPQRPNDLPTIPASRSVNSRPSPAESVP